MKPNGSTLNPNAQDYIPIKRRAPGLNGPPQGLEQHFNSALNLNVQANNVHFLPHNPLAGPSQIVNGGQEHFEMCVEYLKMKFPKYSEKSLAEAYAFNKYDLEATEDLLNEVEGQTIQYKMVIVDHSGSSTQAQSSTQKPKSVPGTEEGSGSS